LVYIIKTFVSVSIHPIPSFSPTYGTRRDGE
jgi:hypothetical protein